MRALLLLSMVFTVFVTRAAQNPVKIACVGDSITAGYLSSGGNHTYPGQLQILMDKHHGEGAYSVTNLGAGGATLLRHGDSPYWKRSQYNELINDTWDIVIIMLGTNDAKSTNWPSQNQPRQSSAGVREVRDVAVSSETTLVLHGIDDLVLSGGAGLTTGISPAGALRSGGPGQNSVAASHMMLTPGSTIERVAFSYRYDSGYGVDGFGLGANFSVRVGDKIVYKSPHFTDYSFNHNRGNYSPPVEISATNLSISVADQGLSRLEFDFTNNDRNVQLLLPISINLTCAGADACATAPPPTPPPCGGADAPALTNCQFANDYKALIDKVRTLGSAPDGPTVYVMTPVPLMATEYGMDLKVINSLYPKLVPLIQQNSGVRGPIDAFTGMGGAPDWDEKFPAGGCTRSTIMPKSCQWYCDSQSCDQCHPNDKGYAQLAEIVYAGLDLSGTIIV